MSQARKSPVRRFDGENWEELVLRSEEPVFVDFLIPERPSFLILSSHLLRLRQDWAGIAEVGYLDVTQELPLALRYPVADLPTLALFYRGKIVKSYVGPTRFGQNFREPLSRLMAVLPVLDSVTWITGETK